MKSLYGKNLASLQELCAAERLPRFAAKQIARHLYVRRTADFALMTDLSLEARARLAATCSTGASRRPHRSR